MQEINVDVLIIGAGPAGLAAAIYTARAGKKTLVIKGKAKSHLELAHKVENYPGIMSATGSELLQSFKDQATSFGAEILENEVLELALNMDIKMVTTRDAFITAKSVILAMGKGQHKQSIKNEEDFVGRGVSYCASCDGAFYKGRNVVVYGNDSEAVDDALMLQQLGCKTSLLLYCGGNNCADALIDKALNHNINVIRDTEIISVNGNSSIESITIKAAEGQKDLPTDGLFIIQEIPSGTLIKKSGIKTSNKDCIDVNRHMNTSLPGVFAAGDITCGGMQISVAVGEGVTASLEALKYLRQF